MKFDPITAIALSVFCLAATPPDTESVPDKAAINQLIIELDHPVASKRAEAEERLRELGPQVIPFLEDAAEDASFEARIKIKELLDNFRVRGAIVLSCIGESQASYQKIRAGDVITAVNGVPVDNYKDFSEKNNPLANSPRTLTVRTGPRLDHDNVKTKSKLPAERQVELGPGKIGVYLGDYDGKYGEPLSLAMQRIYNCRWEPLWADARADIEEALAAGLVFDNMTMLEPMYAATCYYAGDQVTAYKHFEAFTRRSANNRGWWSLMNGLNEIIECDGHLALYFARQQLLVDPQDAGAALNIAYAHSWSQSRFLDASVWAISTLNGHHGEFSEWGRGVGLNALQHALSEMGLISEAGEVAEQLSRVEEASKLFGKAFRAAERSGRHDLAMKLGEAEIERNTRWNRLQYSMADELFRYCLREGHLDDAKRILREYDDESSIRLLIEYLRECDMRWAESQTILADFARQCVALSGDDRHVLQPAFLILSRQTTLDMDELERIVKVRNKDNHTSYSGGRSTNYSLYLNTMLALLKEQHDEVERLLKSREEGLPASFRKAATFLREHGSNLTGEQALWTRTFRAYDRPAGGYYLQTRDQHIGWSDNSTCKEIPLPEAVWSFVEPDFAFVLSDTGKTVLTVGRGAIYKLRADESGWERLCAIPVHDDRFTLWGLEPVLDEVVELIEKSDEPIDLVWKSAPNYGTGGGPPVASMVFSDGTWIYHYPSANQLFRVSQEIGAALKRSVEIYFVYPNDSSGERFWVYTNQGLIEWKPKTGEAITVALPGVDDTSPVMIPKIPTRSVKAVRFSLFPDQGGTTFLLDKKTREVTVEGLVNESYPETYWLQRSEATKREMFTEAIKKHNLVWPPPVDKAVRDDK